MTDVIRIDYEGLEKIAAVFAQQSESIAQMLQQVGSSMSPLQGGGWIGLNGLGIFMDGPGSVVDNFFRHLDYYCELLGPESIGFGTDFLYDIDDMKRYMKNIKSPQSGGYDRIDEQIEPEFLPAIVERMLQAGYPDVAVRGILGENYLRVLSQVQLAGHP